MLVLITYDVSTEHEAGKKRLRQVAKICTNYGQRVQNSVFECVIDEGQYRMIKDKLQKTVNLEEDSIRFYRLGNKYKEKICHIGTKKVQSIEEPLIF